MKSFLSKLFVLFALILTASLCGVETYRIKMTVEMECPASEELQAFINAQPVGSEESLTDYQQWKFSFLQSISRLEQLVESEKIYNSSWSVTTDKIQDN